MTDEPQHGRLEDLWSWIDSEDPAGETPLIEPAAVTAVMVVHDAAEWLPRQLLALAGLDPRPGRIVAVDTGSVDDSRDLVLRAVAEGVLDELVDADAGSSFGEAVSLALAESEPEWIWLLHDDSSPHPDTLAHLLDGARQADVVVPKLLEPKRRNYPDTLSEVGQAITPGGQRVPLVEEGDVDQQQTEPREVLGGSTAGMLVRGEVWREIGGLAPEVARHRDGVDLGWRANAVGYRVLTWPAAALVHRRAGRTGERPSDLHPHEDDRLAALRVAGARGTSRAGVAVGSTLRALGFLLAKSPGHAGAELAAMRRYLGTAEVTAALAARLPEEDLTPEDLLPNRFWPLRHAVDKLGAGVSERFRDLREADTTLDDLTGDDFAGGPVRRRVISPVTALLVLLAVASVAAGRTLLGLGAVSGGGLLPAPGSIGAVWEAYLSGEAPWMGVAAVAALAGLGSPGWFAFLALLATPLLAGLSALALLRRLGVTLAVGAAVSAAWAGATILLGLVTAGDVSGMVLAVVGPLLARAVHAVVRNEAAGAERLRAPAGAAFWLVIASLVWPVLLVLATLAAVGWAVRDRSRVADVAVGVLPAWVFFAPWLGHLLAHPGRLFTGVDPNAWPDFPPASFALVVGRILPSGLPLWANVTFFAVLALVAVVALARLSGTAWRWAIAGIAAPLVIGTLLSRLVVTVDGGTARVLLSPWALLVVAALLAPVVAAALAGTALTRSAVALGVSGLLAAGVWAVVGFNGPVDDTASALPGYVRDVLDSPRDTRALMIELTDDGALAWNVVDARQPQWGTGERNPAGDFSAEFRALVQAFSTGAVPDDVAGQLTALGTSHVWLRGFDPELRAALDNAAGMTSAAADAETVVWTVLGLVSRSQVVDGETAEPLVQGRVEEGAAGRTLVVAEPPDADWQATLDGRPLQRIDGADRLTFDLGQSAGEVAVQPRPHPWRFAVQLAVAAVLAVLAAPTLGAATVARRGQE
ncbi:glycosyltransferase family 2 protein [Tessaracoccus sp. MC1679]|uniref:glycosyltransferase family 2 protein n=1 Tax=Tessaracoccus sp. MC1679 TaxID=2760313 RepID=UPI0015FF6F34|nr:glycosyltransferase family 2 protein [Tessaracoccus sp. MC1679]